jgi:adenylate cyclase
MEKELAILFADLSGYTALTETHGAEVAANLIDDYLDIVRSSSSDRVQLHQTIGDEVLLISEYPEDLFNTTVLLRTKCFGKPNFLQLHGGLHFGKILWRNNNLFGPSINYASRIASVAQPGQFLSSVEFIEAIDKKFKPWFESTGVHPLKNVKGGKELFELKFDKVKPVYIDPVCRMFVDPETAIRHPEEQIFFCSVECLSQFTI